MQELLEFMNQYGWPGIIALVIILAMFILYKLMKKHTGNSLEKGFNKVATTISEGMTKQNEMLINTINENNKQMLNYIIDEKDKDHEDSIEQRLNAADHILQKIRDLSNMTHASRVSVLEFHNSKENFSGLSFVWYDMQYEWPAKGVEPITDVLKNTQAARIMPIIKRINNTPNSSLIMLNREELDKFEDDEPLLYNDLVRKLNLSHIVYSGLYDVNNGRIIGLLAIEFNYEIEDEEVMEFEKEYIAAASVIEDLLTFIK